MILALVAILAVTKLDQTPPVELATIDESDDQPDEQPDKQPDKVLVQPRPRRQREFSTDH